VVVELTLDNLQKTDATAPTTPIYTTPSLFDAFAPPVPPLPVEHQRTPVGSPIADVFSASQRISNSSKPLPPISDGLGFRPSEDSDERSMVFVDKVVVEDIGMSSQRSNTIKSGKRRSMSIGEAELKKAMTSTSPISPLRSTFDQRNDTPSHLDDPTLNGILDDFKGELSQLDPVSGSSFVLRDPSTPRRAAFRSKTDGLILHTTNQEARLDKSSSTPTNSASSPLILQIPFHQTEDPSDRPSAPSSPIIPPRRSSLQRSTSRPHSIGSPRGITSRHPPSPLRSRSGPALGLSSPNPRDTTRLRTLHRSTASSSEPSLISTGDDARICEFYCSIDMNALMISCSITTYRFSTRPCRQ
jgi:PH and SEC7 domain-containing protein